MERTLGFEKALQNESSAIYATTNYIERHSKAFKEAMGKDSTDLEMAEALEYLVLKDLQWNRDKGRIGQDYEIAPGWDWGRANATINAGDRNEKFKRFVTAWQTAMQESRDTMLANGQITPDEHAALSENPFYVMKHRVDTGLKKGGKRGDLEISRRDSDEVILDSLTKEGVEGYLKNPMEAFAKNAYYVHQKALQNDTFIKAYDIAKLDDEGALFQEITKEQYGKFGGLKGKVNGEEKYLAVQDDLLAMMDETDNMNIPGLTNVTRWMAHLKTSSLEHQVTAVPRDLATGLVNSQIKNPARYMWEIGKATFNRSASKELGATFGHNAFSNGHDIDPSKLMKAYAKEHGNVKVFNPKDPKSWKATVDVLTKIVTTPYKVVTAPSRALGNFSDEVVREVEAKETKRIFMNTHGKDIKALEDELVGIETQLSSVEGIVDDFDPRLQGIENVKTRKTEIENELRKYQQDLKREQIYRARDMMNYNRTGRAKFVKALKSNVMFANTTTQSKDKLMRSLIERPVSTGAKIALVTAPFVIAEQAMVRSMSDEDREVYELTPDWMKQSNYVFVNDGEVYTVPKIHELALITNPIEAMMAGESLSSSMKYATKELSPYQLGHITQGLVPDEEGKTLFDRDKFTKVPEGITMPAVGPFGPIMDITTNDKMGFNRKPISYSSDKANKWTTEAGRLLGGGDTPNADAVEYLARQYGGDVGKYGIYGLDAILGSDESEDTKKARIDALLQNLNPLQDRAYGVNKYFKPIIQDKPKE